MTKKKEKMTDNEIMLFNELLMSKINKRKIQPLENDQDKKEVNNNG